MELIECSKVHIQDALNSPILPQNVKNDLKDAGETFLSVYSRKSKSLRFFPIKDENIYWLKIAIDSFSPEISGKILAKLSNLISQFVYSTGVCVSKSECFWDGIIPESAFKNSKENLVKTLEGIPNVSNVTLKPVTKE